MAIPTKTRQFPSVALHQSPGDAAALRISAYERVASTIVSLLIFLVPVVLILSLVALTQRSLRVEATVPVEYVENESGRSGAASIAEQEPDPPGSEVSELIEEPQAKKAMETVLDAVASIAAVLASVEDASALVPAGNAVGVDRSAGPSEDLSDIIPRSERWQIQYPSGNLKQYGRILDFFEIELGVVGGGRKEVEYAVNLSTNPAKRTGPPEKEERLYMTWRGGEMKEADAQLLSQAGINARGAVQMQFLPAATENLLAGVERTAMGQRTMKEVQKTVFGVRPKAPGFEFYVVDQRYRVVR